MLRGKLVDHQTRCIHYHSPLDIIAIKFKCCGDYYPCYECHSELADHAAEIWKKEERGQKAIFCGVCHTELTIAEYLEASDNCPQCGSRFNPGCSKHYHLYFEI